MIDEVAVNGMTEGSSGSTVSSCTGSGSGAGAGAGFGAAFFFLGFLDPIIAPHAPRAQQRQHKPIRVSHCQVLMKEPQEPEPVEPELALEPDESPEEPHLNELL